MKIKLLLAASILLLVSVQANAAIIEVEYSGVVTWAYNSPVEANILHEEPGYSGIPIRVPNHGNDPKYEIGDIYSDFFYINTDVPRSADNFLTDSRGLGDGPNNFYRPSVSVIDGGGLDYDHFELDLKSIYTSYEDQQDDGQGNYDGEEYERRLNAEDFNTDFIQCALLQKECKIGELSLLSFSLDSAENFNGHVDYMHNWEFQNGEIRESGNHSWSIEFDIIALTVGPIAPSPVPEPQVLLLFGTDLLGLIGVRWRRKAA
jgi:hypothetical protein